MGNVTAPPVTRRQRAAEITEREADLALRQREADRRRAATFRETGLAVPLTGDQRQIQEELRALGRKRRALLAQNTREQTALRQRQAELDRARATAGRGGKASLLISRAEKQLRAAQAALDSERAVLDGTVQRDRDTTAALAAIYESVQDPVSDW